MYLCLMCLQSASRLRGLLVLTYLAGLLLLAVLAGRP
jgi:hypothetical protein